MALTRIHHIGIAVHDVDKAAELWRDTFGLETAIDMEIESQGVRGVIFPLDNCEIELLEPTRDDTGFARNLESHGEGFHHICLESTDVAGDLIAAKASGMQMIDEEPREGLAGMIGFIHPRSNHGVLIEYAQPPDHTPHHSGPTSGPGPHAMHHVTVAVNEIAPVRDKWTERYGMVGREPFQAEALGLEGQFLDLGPTAIELVRPLPDSEGPLPRKLERGEGMFMMALTVRDAEKSVTYLRDQGMTVTDANTGAFISPRNTNRARLRLSEA